MTEHSQDRPADRIKQALGQAVEIAHAETGFASTLRRAIDEAKAHGRAQAESLAGGEIPKAWSFKDDAVAAKFDDHVREQLSWYDPLSRFCADLAVSFVPRGGVVYDIGASTGNMTRLMKDDLKAKGARAFSIEPSHQMAKHFAGSGDLFVIEAERVNFEADRPDVAILFLVLMFMPTAERRAFLERLCAAIRPGGALVLVDKGYLRIPAVQVACKAAHLAEKRRAGMSDEAYVTKELSLRGEQRPTSREAIVDYLLQWGFEAEDIFRFGEFYGLLAVKCAV